MKSITGKELIKKVEAQEINPKNIIDVRSKMERLLGKIDKSTHIPLTKISETKALNKDETYYIICAAGGRSASACSTLEAEGYKVVNVEGGMGGL